MEAAPEFFPTGYYDSPEERLSNADQFAIDDLLDFPNDDDADGGLEAALIETSSDSSLVAAADTSCNSPFSAIVNAAELHLPHSDVGGPRGSAAGQFSGELSVPYDDLAELEWVSRFEYESFSTEDVQKLQLIQGIKARPETTPTRGPESSLVPAKARSKRSHAASGNWTSRPLAVSPTPSPADSTISSSQEAAAKKAAPMKKKETHDGGDGRKCLHCATDKTPQWRTGPMGPKTLCNACGVRYKSGRLVPEYRPASSPTFVLSKHSNSHRKVLELRRQKEMQKGPSQTQPALPYLHYHRHQNVMFDASDGDDYLIHQHIGPDFRQMI